MFIDEGSYAQWFWGKIGELQNIRTNSAGVDYCRVSWLNPVLYFGKYTSVSSFKLSNFEVYKSGK